MCKTVGIIAAKGNSKRFPNKNIYKINGIPMFWHSVQPLLDSDMVDDVYVTTDSIYIKEYCEKNKINIIWRGINAIRDEEPLLSVINFTYKQIDKKYDNIITIMANCPNHTKENVDNAIKLINSGRFLEIRSFGNNNEENGLMVFKEDIILNKLQISSHIGSINSNAKEIHTKKDLQ